MTSKTAALVTGGAVRLGAAIVERLARSGRDVAIHCNRSVEAAETLARRLEAECGVRAVVVSRDLADPSIGSIVAEASVALGAPLGVLVNSASLYRGDALSDIEPDVFDLHMAVNVRAPLLLTRAFADQAVLGGSVVNILDQRVLRPTPHFLSYSLSKDALHAATLKSAQSLAPKGIRVNGVAPGLTLPGDRQDRVEYDRRIAGLPLRRGGSAYEVADAVGFLVDAAPSVTGQVIAVDGGQHLAWQDADVPDTAAA